MKKINIFKYIPLFLNNIITAHEDHMYRKKLHRPRQGIK